MKGFWELLIKGIPIGISNTLPGISGGTMALVLGIYECLIVGIKKIKLQVLIPIFLGAVVGVIVGSKLITSLLVISPNFIMAFLLGLIFASSRVTYDEIEKFNLKTIGLAVLGLVIAYFYSVDISQVGDGGNISLIRFFFGGAVGSIAMILPGVSGGTVLIMLGLYQGVLEAISNFNLLALVVFGLGVGSGLLIFSWLLSYFLNRFNSLLMAFLTGLILGSMRSVIPSTVGLLEILGFVLGIIVIWLLSRIKN